MAQQNNLFSYGFVALSLTALFGFCNIAIFYSFYHYLETIGIPHQWIGTLLALEPLTAFVLRPVISPLLHAKNGLRCIRYALVANGVALVCYPFATTIVSLVAVRIFHGMAFVVLVSSIAALIVLFIPPEKSGQGFGVFSLMTLLPYAILPPLNEWVLTRVGNEASTYALAAVFMLPALACLVPLGKIVAQKIEEHGFSVRPGSPWADVVTNLKTPGIGIILGANFCFFVSSTTIFYLIKDFAPTIGVSNAGMFFTVSTVAVIVMRMGGSGFFDRVDKKNVLLGAGGLFCMALFAFGHLYGQTLFLLNAAIYGACLGVILPLLNASMFLVSAPNMRGLNTNLMLFMMDAGYVVGPFMGASIMGGGYSYSVLFGVAACCSLMGVFCVARLPRLQPVSVA